MSDIALIQRKIYEVRGQKVILDRDLAALYGVDTAQLKRAVRRNIKRFEGEDFIDEDDKVFYEVALSKDDGYVVTGNTKHFPKSPIVVTPAEMIAIIQTN